VSTDILFIGFGAFVAEVKSTHQCRLIPWVSGKAPSYTEEHQFAYDAWSRLEYWLDPANRGSLTLEAALARVVSDDLSGEPYRLPTIGPQFPYGKHEGSIYLRAEDVDKRDLLRDTPRDRRAYEYHLVARIADDGSVRRYHGFHASKLKDGDKDAIVQVGSRLLRFDPALDDVFYAGRLADPNALSLDPGVREGALYVEVAHAYQQAMALPKIPPGAGD
jgi:hypothetical protein